MSDPLEVTALIRNRRHHLLSPPSPIRHQLLDLLPGHPVHKRHVLPQVRDADVDLAADGAHGEPLVQLGVRHERAARPVAPAADAADELTAAVPCKQQSAPFSGRSRVDGGSGASAAPTSLNCGDDVLH